MKKMKRQFAIVMIAAILLSVLTVIPVMSQSEYGNVTHFIPEVDKATGICKMLYFSTEEDFVTQGPEPADGNPIISDGDLLGPGCVVFARNHKLLTAFKTERDLVDGKCPEHSEVEWMSEEAYFFKLSKYKDKIIEF